VDFVYKKNFSFQLSVQKQLKALQEENRALQQALDHAPSLAQLEEAHKQIGNVHPLPSHPWTTF